MGLKVTNNAFGTLNAGITNSDTTLVLQSGQGSRFPSLSSGDYFYATLIDTSNNLEIVKVTARSTDTMTIVRAQDNTTARAYSTNDRFELRPTAAMLNEVITKAETAQATADAALPKAGGTMTGPLALTSNSSVGAGNYALLKFGGDAAADDFHIVRETSGFNLYSGVAGSGIRRFGVDASGRVTEPAQPSFSGYMTTNQTLLSDVWTKVLINTTRFNVGSHFNGTNNRFTAPVTGKYIFNYTVNFSSATGPYNYTGLQVNGAFYHYGFGLRNYDGWQGDNTLSAAQIVQLNAGDYVELHAYAAGGVLLLSGGERCSFAGYLLG